MCRYPYLSFKFVQYNFTQRIIQLVFTWDDSEVQGPQVISQIECIYYFHGVAMQHRAKTRPLGAGKCTFIFYRFSTIWGLEDDWIHDIYKIASNPYCKFAYTWWPKNISHRFSLWKIPVKMDNTGNRARTVRKMGTVIPLYLPNVSFWYM